MALIMKLSSSSTCSSASSSSSSSSSSCYTCSSTVNGYVRSVVAIYEEISICNSISNNLINGNAIKMEDVHKNTLKYHGGTKQSFKKKHPTKDLNGTARSNAGEENETREKLSKTADKTDQTSAGGKMPSKEKASSKMESHMSTAAPGDKKKIQRRESVVPSLLNEEPQVVVGDQNKNDQSEEPLLPLVSNLNRKKYVPSVPPLRSKKWFRRYGRNIKSDGDIWLEKFYLHPKGEKIRYFRSIKEGRYQLWEPPTGAGVVITQPELKYYADTPAIFNVARECETREKVLRFASFPKLKVDGFKKRALRRFSLRRPQPKSTRMFNVRNNYSRSSSQVKQLMEEQNPKEYVGPMLPFLRSRSKATSK